jgi:hypothetical protein
MTHLSSAGLVKFSLEGSKDGLVVISACSRCKIPKEKVHVSKYKIWTFTFGQTEMKQAIEETRLTFVSLSKRFTPNQFFK